MPVGAALESQIGPTAIVFAIVISGVLTWRIQQRGAEIHVAIKGQVDEASDLTPIAAEIGPGLVVFDTSGIDRINSMGCKQWLRFMQVLDGRGNQTVLQNCSMAMAQQIVMIRGFEGGGAVRSVFAPYFCSACDHEKLQLVELSQGFDVNEILSIPCDKCPAAMELDDLPEVYERLATLS